jgi:formate dehydrogenase subunit delta
VTAAEGQPHEDHSRERQLVKMANDIGDFFKGQGEAEEAITEIAKHMKSFWTRSMIAKLSVHVENGAPDLADLPRNALRRLNAGNVKHVPSPGGDAG